MAAFTRAEAAHHESQRKPPSPRRRGRGDSSIRCQLYVEAELGQLEADLHDAIAHGAWDTAKPLQQRIEALNEVKAISTRETEMAIRRRYRDEWREEAKAYAKMEPEEARHELRMGVNFNDLEMVKRAIAGGATSTWGDLLGDGSGNSALYVACVKGHLSLAKWLVEAAGANARHDSAEDFSRSTAQHSHGLEF